MDILHILLAAIIVLGPLIAIHEFGHFWVARRLGVKVLAYSIGFGPALWSRKSQDGTEYRIAAIPLGGYVKMADEREGEVPEADIPRAFNRQPVLARMAIVAAGPLINLAFAVFLFWILFMQGVETLRTVVGVVKPNSPAAVAGLQSGDEILRIDGRQTPDWESVTYALVDRMGESGKIVLTVKPAGAVAPSRDVAVQVEKYLKVAGDDPLRSLGFLPYQPILQPVIGDVKPGGPADTQGMKAGDRVRTADGKPIATWQEFVDVVRTHPEKPFAAEVVRTGGTVVALNLTPRAQKDELGVREGKLDIGVSEQKIDFPPAYLQRQDYGPVAALVQASRKTWSLIDMTLASLGKMVVGLVGLDNLSGPITIAKVAGHSASIGWEALIGFMALLSVSLGVLNLLPIPVLDGGHLVFYAIEGVLGKPLPEQVQEWGVKAGVAIMGSLMLLAIFNDLVRQFG
ncbi:regulator of sigma E protease [Fluviicoccus keumensis]|uniref:Zinc metalloprotease n=1 Tax=Fluviicoccus keumensis TaxID=1435465 RepID=A0A4Q7Z5B5_9GAMM|nr:RIP metalloprotease RseP [Fluviicoccus keumensis]RZU44839.1 regulator of sigma E protease [Fluviicoccus keumensis]